MGTSTCVATDLPFCRAGVVCVKFSKREIRHELGKGSGLFTNAGGEVAAAGAPQGHGSGADAKSESAAADE
jgi:hypothetical protein